ncbi:hypothetical protein BpHYR1_046249 [Brachionus plicatilis]|uniref:Uncharacterized protein n=1 Tax=Brachionus plicatilis TaxID=10195 RepID=A0A3M7PKL0_BRAPC|nr:hypothetical protein BpHYR1_046249 [Brachionus plicatilis]
MIFCRSSQSLMKFASVKIKTYLYAFLLLDSSSTIPVGKGKVEEESRKNRAKEMYKLVLNCNYLILGLLYLNIIDIEFPISVKFSISSVILKITDIENSISMILRKNLDV